MKHILYYTVILVLLFASCKTSKDYLARIDDDKTLFDVVKVLGKHTGDSDAVKALPVIYAHAQEKHLKKIAAYKNSTDLARWDKIIGEYNILQKMYDAISQEERAGQLVSATNYQSTIYDLKQTAADEYYLQATTLLEHGGRPEAKDAYNYFKKADKLVPGFRDARLKMNDAYQAAIIDVQINPVTDNSFFFNSSWGNYGYNYSNEYFQQNLVNDLGGKNANRYPARFYTDWEARRDNVDPDIVVNLSLRNMDIPRHATQNYSRNNSTRVVVGKDTSGNAIYQTVYANINISRLYFTARIEFEVEITDGITRRVISRNTYREEYSWQEEHATYSGDQRAIGDNDWNIINNSRFNEPRKEEVLNELYRKVYPQVKNRIVYAVDW